MKKFQRGEKLHYVGLSFEGFDEADPFCEFIEYDGLFSAKVLYKDKESIVYLNGLKPVKEKGSLLSYFINLFFK